MNIRRHLKWMIPAALVLILGIWIAADTLRNLSYEVVPARPAEKIPFDENGLLWAFANDEPVTEEEVDANIDGICTYIDGRYDCSDFRIVSLMRILYLYPDKLTDSQYERIKTTLLNFKYWMDEPGADSMCYWSENHQVLFATAELLAGQLWPDEVFSNNGMTGLERQEKAAERLHYWLDQRWDYGFIEWYSNVYYVEDIGPLANLIDFAEDGEIRRKATMIMDLLLYDLASQSWKGTFVSNSGRLYENNKKGGNGNSMKRVTQELFGYPQPGAEERKGMDLSFLFVENYEIPEVLRAIGRDEVTRIIRSTNGMNLDEIKEEGLIGMRTDQIMMQLGMESFTNPEVIANTVDIINRYDMLSQRDLNAFSMVNYGLLRHTGLLPVVSRILKPQSDGVSIQRSNSYMYRTPAYSLSTSQAYHPGTHGDQQHIWQATLSSELSIFTTHPAVMPGQGGPNGNSPLYWVGSGRLPHSVQHENVNLTVYRLPEKAGMMEKRMIHYTHLWFPEDRFDEVVADPTRIFGRVGDTYAAVSAGSPLEYGQEVLSDNRQQEILEAGEELPLERREVIQNGRDTWWITELSTAEKDGSFEAFMDRIRQNPINWDPTAAGGAGSLSYTSRGTTLEVDFGGDFRINGVVEDTEYPRYDAPYVRAPRKPDTITWSWGGHELFLDYRNLVREIR